LPPERKHRLENITPSGNVFRQYDVSAVQLGDHQGERLTDDEPEREPAVQRVAQPLAGAEPV